MNSTKRGIVLVWDKIGDMSYLLYAIHRQLAERYTLTVIHSSDLEHTFITNSNVDAVIVFELSGECDLRKYQFIRRLIVIRKNFLPGGYTITMPRFFDTVKLPVTNFNQDRIFRLLTERVAYYNTHPTHHYRTFSQQNYVLALFSNSGKMSNQVLSSSKINLIRGLGQMCERDIPVVAIDIFGNPATHTYNNIPIVRPNMHTNTTGVDMIHLVANSAVVVGLSNDVVPLARALGRNVVTTNLLSDSAYTTFTSNLGALEVVPCDDITVYRDNITEDSSTFYITGDPELDARALVTNLTWCMETPIHHRFDNAAEQALHANYSRLWMRMYAKIGVVYINIPHARITGIPQLLFKPYSASDKNTLLKSPVPHIPITVFREVEPELLHSHRTFAIVADPFQRLLDYVHMHNNTPGVTKLNSLAEVCGLLGSTNRKTVYLEPQASYLTNSEGTVLVDDLIPSEHTTRAWLELCSRYNLTGELIIPDRIDPGTLGFPDIDDPTLRTLVREFYTADYAIYEEALYEWHRTHP
jgi:hypothetical protein